MNEGNGTDLMTFEAKSNLDMSAELVFLWSSWYSNSLSTGSSVMCAMNRASIYVLLLIMFNLSALSFQIVTALFGGQKSMNKNRLKVLPTVVPIILLIIGYSLEGFFLPS